jgi:transposase-like protein
MLERFSLVEFFKKYPDEDSAIRYFESLRWENGVKCPYCGSLNVSACKRPMPHRCRACRKHFSVRVNTILEDSKLPLQKWLLAIYILVNSKKGISSIQLSEYLNVTQKTAWFLAHRIRESWIADSEKFSGIVEVDETYVGGLEKNKHKDKKLHAGRGMIGKFPVVGIKARIGKVKAFAVEKTNASTLENIIRKNVVVGSSVFTDEARAYNNLPNYRHENVKHDSGEYVKRKMIHTNGIESFWAVLKRGYYGIYHKWSDKHLQRYVNEFCSHFNMRKIEVNERMRLSIVGGFYKHLSYKELINE